jgi:hypothetical protein
MYLLFKSRPSAVRGTVSAIIIYSVDRFSGWATAHIGKKVWIFIPAFANLDAAPAVILPTRNIRISAACTHSTPNSVFSCPPIAVCRAIWKILAQTSARSAFAANQMPSKNFSLVSAIAADMPKSVANIAQSNPASEPLSGDIDQTILCQTAAGAGISLSEQGSRDISDAAAVAAALPHRKTSFALPSIFQRDKSTEMLSGDIEHGDLRSGLPMKWRPGVDRVRLLRILEV